MDMNIREYIKALQDRFGIPIKVAHNTMIGISKRFALSEYEGVIDYRQVLQNEIVFEIDSYNWCTVRDVAIRICTVLNDEKIPHHVEYSGGKGIHIHVFFEISESDKNRVTTNNITMRNIRKEIHVAICKMAGIRLEIVGHGLTIDTATVSWNDDSQGWLIREVGGVKLDKMTRKPLGIAILLHNIPNKKPSTLNIETGHLEFPDIKSWNVPPSLITKIIAKTKRFRALESKDIQVPLGEHLSLPCVKKCLRGLENGKRNSGAQLISIASKCDALSRQKAMEVAEAYFARIDHDRISMCEIEQWFRWAYGKKDVFWDGRTCGLAQRLKLCDPRCKHRYDSHTTAIS